jgi:hypothetical protein
MAEAKGRGGRQRRPGRKAREIEKPLPLEPVDLLAGLAPGVVLEADDLPAGVAGAEETTPATATVDEIGRMLRSGDSTLRRLVRGRSIGAARGRAPDAPPADRAGVPPRDPERPGE